MELGISGYVALSISAESQRIATKVTFQRGICRQYVKLHIDPGADIRAQTRGCCYLRCVSVEECTMTY
jgi:hypothetical protein